EYRYREKCAAHVARGRRHYSRARGRTGSPASDDRAGAGIHQYHDGIQQMRAGHPYGDAATSRWIHTVRVRLLDWIVPRFAKDIGRPGRTDAARLDDA